MIIITFLCLLICAFVLTRVLDEVLEKKKDEHTMRNLVLSVIGVVANAVSLLLQIRGL